MKSNPSNLFSMHPPATSHPTWCWRVDRVNIDISWSTRGFMAGIKSMMILWHGNTFLYRSFVRGIVIQANIKINIKSPLVTGDSHQWRFDVYFDISLNKLLNKLSICQWFDAPWHSCYITGMWWHNLNGWVQDCGIAQVRHRQCKTCKYHSFTLSNPNEAASLTTIGSYTGQVLTKASIYPLYLECVEALQ